MEILESQLINSLENIQAPKIMRFLQKLLKNQNTVLV